MPLKEHSILPSMPEIFLGFLNIHFSFTFDPVTAINKFLLCYTIQISTQVLGIVLLFS